jgi:hypothetical protein
VGCFKSKKWVKNWWGVLRPKSGIKNRWGVF